MRIYFIITVYLLIQICLTATPTKNKRHTTTKNKQENKQDLDGKLLHDDAKFDHNKAEGSWKKHQKLNVSDPSADQLEKEIRVRGHENEKVNKTQKLNVKEPSIDEAEKELRVRGHEKDKKEAPAKLNVNEPSVDDLEKEIKIPGHEKDKKEPKKLNISEPSIDGLEQTIKIQGHERDPKENKAHNISEPSLDEIEKQLQVQGHENDKKAPEKILNMEPDVGNLDGELLHANPRFDHMKKSTKKQNLTNIEPSNQLLEDIIKIENGSLNEAPKINRSDILPNYEGFHGFLVHGDETFQHDKGNDEGGKGKPADMDDFNKWLQDQGNESKLDRFKRLNNEFESLSKRMEEHDHDFKTKASSSDLKNPREKLKRAIKEIEEEEKKRKIKTDL